MKRAGMVAGALAAVALAGTVAATNLGGATYSPSSFTQSRSTGTWRTTNDSYWIRANTTWNTTHRNGIQNYVQNNGWRYTQEINDSSGNLNATGQYVTGFPNPKYDKDDDDNNRRWEEAEVTADNTSFPTAGYSYVNVMMFSRWYEQCTKSCAYWWDADSGVFWHLSQMSSWSGLQGEWNANLSSGVYANTSYPTQAQPAGAIAATAGDPSSIAESGAVSISTSAGLQILLEREGLEWDVVVVPTQSIADRRADDPRTLGPGGGRRLYAVITFSKPIDPARFAQIGAIPGVTLTSYEAIGTWNDPTTLTVGGPASGVDTARIAFEEEGGRMLGVVSAEALLEGQDAYERLISEADIALVDLSGEAALSELRRQGIVVPAGTRLDIVLNDSYWELTGRVE